MRFKVQQETQLLSEGIFRLVILYYIYILASHAQRFKYMREVFQEDKKLDWMFDAPDV